MIIRDRMMKRSGVYDAANDIVKFIAANCWPRFYAPEMEDFAIEYEKMEKFDPTFKKGWCENYVKQLTATGKLSEEERRATAKLAVAALRAWLAFKETLSDEERAKFPRTVREAGLCA